LDNDDKNSDLSDENSHLAPSSHDSEKEIEMNQLTTAKRQKKEENPINWNSQKKMG